MWVTLWYMGFIIMTMGYPEMSIDACETIKTRVEYDIFKSYEDPRIAAELMSDGFAKEGWKVTCETKDLNQEI